MKAFDFNTVVIGEHTGYGNASRLLVESLESQGATMAPGSSICLNFTMPDRYRYGDYTIGYTPWESTEIPDRWLHGIRKVDDLWTTSSWVAEILRKYTSRDIFVLPHGVENCWKPRLRKRAEGPFTFLHIGEPAVRKGGDIVLEAWHKKFASMKDVKLVMKCAGYPIARVKDRSGSIVASPASMDNVEVKSRIYGQQEMLELMYGAHCMVYPSRGEGFGLIPFEAMATGMPTILPANGGTKDFAHYGISLRNSMWVSSTYENIHPGLWLDHDVDEVIDKMLHVMNNYEEHSYSAFMSAGSLHDTYNWNAIARRALDRMP